MDKSTKKRIAFVFPGQATHYPGMGKKVAHAHKEAMEFFEYANDLTGAPISKLCFEGPEEELVLTEFAQPSIHTTSLAILQVLEKQYGLKAEVTGGYSLGQYSALVYAKALKFEQSVKVVKYRGFFMQTAVPVGTGKMVALLGINAEDVDQLVLDCEPAGHIQISNYSCPGECIISGDNASMDLAHKLAIERGGKAIFIPVSAPFHTSLLIPAARKLLVELDKIDIQDPQIPYVDNVPGGYFIPGTDSVKLFLMTHVYKPVRWETSMYAMLDQGINTFIELGSRNFLTKVNKRCCIAKGKEDETLCLNVRDPEGIDNMLRVMEDPSLYNKEIQAPY